MQKILKIGFSTFLLVGGVVLLQGCSLGQTGDVSQELTPLADGQATGPVGEAVEEPVFALDELAADSYGLDSGESRLGWSASKVVAKPHTGEVKISDGTFVWSEDGFESAEFVIDMTTISDDDGSEKLVGHLSSEDFFNVEKFPTATLVITDVKNGEKTNMHMVTADLTILDVTEEVEFPATVTVADGTVTALAEFDIDRTLWGITYSSGSVVKDLGDKAIEDEISFSISVSFSAQK